MKKTLALILAAVMCLSTAVCAAEDGVAAAEYYEEIIAEYEQRIMELEALLAERDAEIARLTGENAPLETENTDAGTAAPQYETVEITLENWQEYFELEEFLTFRENGFGETESVRADYMLVTKEGLVCDTDQCRVTVEYICFCGNADYTVDFENRTVAYGEISNIVESRAGVEDMKNVQFWLGGDCDRFGVRLSDAYRNDPQGSSDIVAEVRVLRITGMLCFYKENE